MEGTKSQSQRRKTRGGGAITGSISTINIKRRTTSSDNKTIPRETATANDMCVCVVVGREGGEEEIQGRIRR